MEIHLKFHLIHKKFNENSIKMNRITILSKISDSSKRFFRKRIKDGISLISGYFC